MIKERRHRISDGCSEVLWRFIIGKKEFAGRILPIPLGFLPRTPAFLTLCPPYGAVLTIYHFVNSEPRPR